MHEEPAPKGARYADTARVDAPAPTVSSSSRMLASYVTDIEQLLDERRWDAALRDAFDLPRLAVALADARLRCSAERVGKWCEEWIRPPGAERDAQGLDYERLAHTVAQRAVESTREPETVPMRALRRLQLRRLLRAPPVRFSSGRPRNLPPREGEIVEMCSALIEAARRWYARSAVHDPVVQANLARLAVLR
jgi:hypothetical protein